MDQPEAHPPGEPEFRGPWYKHPYFMYVFLTSLIFAFLVGVAWMAVHFELIPNRGIQ